MQLRIEPQTFEQYPDVILGVAVLSKIDNKGDIPEIHSELRKAETKVVEQIGDTPVVEHPHIIPWREAYRQFGAKPKKYPSSIENLVRRILKGEEVRHINKLVDIYNLVSLKHLVPVGGEDVSKIEGDVLLTIAGENETPVALLGEREERAPYPREVIYKDSIGTICRRWNWKEADRTKLTEETKSAFIVIEGLPPVGKDKIEAAIEELATLIKKHCGGNVSTSILDKNNPNIDIA